MKAHAHMHTHKICFHALVGHVFLSLNCSEVTRHTTGG